MNITEWIQYGIDNGYAETFCCMHDSIPMNEEECKEYYENESDPCIPTLRVWLD